MKLALYELYTTMEEATISLSHKEMLIIDRDYMQAASAVNLVYVRDNTDGITRLKKGKGFAYFYKQRLITDKKLLERIRKLVIPPAWTNVWICALDNGHIQATGMDMRKRKQYRYHPLWNLLRNETKFHRLYEFGKALPALRQQLEADLAIKTLSQQKVLATVISVMERTYVRVGNADYEKANGSYGLTTLKDKHVKIVGDKLIFSFTGKKGIQHDITLENKRLARMVKACRDIPGKELFQYYDEQGNRHPIDSGMVNAYIRAATGNDFSAKDFRTWAGSIHALQALRSIGAAMTVTDCKKNINAALDIVSKKLGNTRTVCKKYYVHPVLFRLYEENALDKYVRGLNEIESDDNDGGLTPEETVLMKILKASINVAKNGG